jgi:hypothetical protein
VVSEWWLPALRPEMSQGDIVASVPFSMITLPVSYLKYTELAKKRSGWEVCDQPVVQKSTQRMHVLAAFKAKMGVVLSHDCELDKPKDNGRILLAPVAPITDVPEATRTLILEQRTRALIPLPDLGNFGTCFADLRSMTSVPHSLVDSSSRIGSMTDHAVLRLHAQLVSFLLRKQLPT